MTFLGELGMLALIALKIIGGALAIIFGLVLAVYMIIVVVIVTLYSMVWGLAISCMYLERRNPPKRTDLTCQ